MSTQLSKFYKDKTVCIIGGAPMGDILPFPEEEIDTYIQINDHCKRNGKPVDVLYHAATGELGLPWHTAKVVCYHVIAPTARCIEEYCEDLNISIIPYRKEVYKGYDSPFGIKFSWLSNFMKEWGIDPLSGIIALVDVLRHNPKKVYLTGMTLYSNGVNLPERAQNHYIQPHVNFLKHLEKTDDRVVFDEALKKALQLPVKHFVAKDEYKRLKKRLSKKVVGSKTIKI